MLSCTQNISSPEVVIKTASTQWVVTSAKAPEEHPFIKEKWQESAYYILDNENISSGNIWEVALPESTGKIDLEILLDKKDGQWEVVSLNFDDSHKTWWLPNVNPKKIRGFMVASSLPVKKIEIRSSGDMPQFDRESNQWIKGLALEEASPKAENLSLLLKNIETALLMGYSLPENISTPLKGKLLLSTNEKKRSYDLVLRSPKGRLAIYPAETGFIPDELLLVTENGPQISIDLLAALPEQELPSPLLADTGTMLHYPREIWRNSRYELFNWTLFPDILSLSTDTYATQARFFKRLAFFVEKPGYAGTLPSDAELTGKHGWNAHDYSASSLASFFSLAEKTDFPLNAEEEILKEISLANGLIEREEKGFSPGKGAIIGTSLETFYEQRVIFMTHESIHGLFFTQPDFQTLCENFWKSLPKEEQQFWINFLSYRSYNVEEDHDLLITEVTAYLLQQPPEEADDYFIGFITPRLLRSRPQLKKWLVPLLQKDPALFSRSVISIGESLEKLYGLNASDFHDLLPEERSGWKIFQGKKEAWLKSLR